jgi:hypothetical protein
MKFLIVVFHFPNNSAATSNVLYNKDNYSSSSICIQIEESIKNFGWCHYFGYRNMYFKFGGIIGAEH